MEPWLFELEAIQMKGNSIVKLHLMCTRAMGAWVTYAWVTLCFFRVAEGAVEQLVGRETVVGGAWEGWNLNLAP